MRDIWSELIAWNADGRRFALARVVETWGSSPQPVGSAMIVDNSMRFAGSVSGGCIEGAVIEEAQQVLATGHPRKVSYGVDDEAAWSVGLSCGGEISVFVERHLPLSTGDTSRAIWEALRERVESNRPAVLLTRLAAAASPHLLISPEGEVTGDWGAATESAKAAAIAAYGRRQSEVAQLQGEAVFAHVFPRRDQLVIIGAGHIALTLVQYGHLLNMDSVVIDPREVFARAERFPVQPTQLHPSWPRAVLSEWDLNEDSYCIVLSHDPKIDDEALHFFLKAPVAYIGALGGRKSHTKRRARLQEAGIPDDEIDRIKGPVGLDIGAETPAEIALSIIAEVIAAKRARST